METIRLICFDLGGVLVRLRGTWAEICEAAGLDVRGSSATARSEQGRHEAMAPYVLGRISHEEWLDRTARALGGLYSHAEIVAIHDEWIAGEYDGVGALIDEIHAAGLATACLSNTNHAHWVRLISPDHYPGVVRLGALHASHLLGLSKPSAAIYRAFERETGRSPSEILFFDDLAVNVDTARASGWSAERIDPSIETQPQIRRVLEERELLPRLQTRG